MMLTYVSHISSYGVLFNMVSFVNLHMSGEINAQQQNGLKITVRK